MILFSIAAVLLSALAAILILHRASAAARRPDADPTLAVYRRQLGEIDDLAERGLLAEGELKAARTEAARRLLHAAETQRQAAAPAGASRPVRLTVLAAAVAAPILAVALYVLLGTPGLGDQPFAKRLDAWTRSEPARLTAPQMAAVLKALVKDRPGDVEPLAYLAKAEVASGNIAAAADAMRKATRLQPRNASLWSDLGIVLLLQGQGEETDAAQAAFRQALAIDPKDAPARYHLGRARIARGDVAGGLGDWRALAADLPPAAPVRQQLQQEIDATAKAGHLIAAQAPAPAAPPVDSSGAPDPRQMVANLAAQLQQDPDNLAGWARLIRSYAVLGEPDKEKAALEQARKQFKGNAEALKTLDGAAAAPQGAE